MTCRESGIWCVVYEKPGNIHARLSVERYGCRLRVSEPRQGVAASTSET
jgi:hypothetical protein